MKRINIKRDGDTFWIDGEEYSMAAARELRDMLSLAFSDKSESLTYLSKEALDAWESDLRKEYRSAGDATDLLKEGRYMEIGNSLIVNHKGEIITFTKDGADKTQTAPAGDDKPARGGAGSHADPRSIEIEAQKALLESVVTVSRKLSEYFRLKEN